MIGNDFLKSIGLITPGMTELTIVGDNGVIYVGEIMDQHSAQKDQRIQELKDVLESIQNGVALQNTFCMHNGIHIERAVREILTPPES